MKPDRLVFLGDSITCGGLYIAYLKAFLMQRDYDDGLVLVNLGLGSETASGLSEPDHPWPRPCVHSRIDRALQESKPDKVVFCYGMNDGIYYPYSEDRFKAYKEGIQKLAERIRNFGADAVAISPPPFDALSYLARGGHLVPAGRDRYSYMNVYENYNQVIERYSDWILSRGALFSKAIDIYHPMVNHTRSRRMEYAEYRSGDGIHPNPEGHWIMAGSILQDLFGIPAQGIPEPAAISKETEFFQLIREWQQILGAAWREHVGHTNPGRTKCLALPEAIIKAEELESRARCCLKAHGPGSTDIE
ncbi:MAG TPA: lysophospholipase [Clostridiales bacterium]|nr:lysophospholipase [Clostridiales bacterium]